MERNTKILKGIDRQITSDFAKKFLTKISYVTGYGVSQKHNQSHNQEGAFDHLRLQSWSVIFGLGSGGGALAGYAAGRVIEDGLHLLKDKVLDGGRELRNDFLNHRHFRPGGPR